MSALEAHSAKIILRQNGRSFHFASHVLGERDGERAARLYALCRTIDDLADDAADMDAADARLLALSRALSEADTSDPVAASALRLHDETGLDRGALRDLIDGVRSDLRPVRIADEAGLIDYCYAVAGTVGVMMCGIFNVRDPRALPFAIDLGIAMQLTNIARDVGADARLGRRYIPATWVGNVEPQALIAPEGKLENDLQEAVRRLLALADRYYASGEAGLGFLPVRARFAILIAARVYRAIGGRIRKLDDSPWRRRAIVSGPRKMAIGGLAIGAFLLNPRLHKVDQIHDASLHAVIQHRPLASRKATSHG